MYVLNSGALCALSGMLVTGLPIPIIANNFSLYYTVSKLKKRLDEREALKRVTSTEVLNTMKNIMNKVNPLDKIKSLNAKDKIKGLNLNPVGKVKGLVTPNGKQHTANSSSAHTSQQSTPLAPRREDSQTRMLALPPNDGNVDVEARQGERESTSTQPGTSRTSSRQQPAGSGESTHVNVDSDV